MCIRDRVLKQQKRNSILSKETILNNNIIYYVNKLQFVYCVHDIKSAEKVNKGKEKIEKFLIYNNFLY